MDSVRSGSAAAPSEVGEEIDPWGGEDEVEQTPSARSLDLQREWEARRLQFHNLGYRDGITAGNNSSVQEGFTVGFHEAVEPGYSWGVARGAASAYTVLPSKLKESLVKDQDAGTRLEALDATLSGISSADAMGMFYKDSILQKGITADDPLQDHASENSRSSSSAETVIEEKPTTSQREQEDSANACCGDSANACCGGDACGASGSPCSSQLPRADGDPTAARHSKSESDDHDPESESHTVQEGNKPVSEEAYNLILKVGTSSSDARQLEVSTTSHLGSMALGQPTPSASTSSTSADSSSCLDTYQRNVSAELEPSSVKLSSFPRPS